MREVVLVPQSTTQNLEMFNLIDIVLVKVDEM
jgi:hypothetical protein